MRTCCLLLLSFLILLQAAAQGNLPSALTGVPASSQSPATPPAAYNSTTTPINYIRLWEPQRPYTDEDAVSNLSRTVEEVRKTTQYFDGLGRPLQTVAWQQGTQKKDIVSASVYDEYGRQSYSYLPFVSATDDGNIKYDPFGEQSTFATAQYPGEQFFYGKTNYEPSPLNRPVETFAPGNSWAGSENSASEHAATVDYGVNEASEVHLWTITNTAVTYNNNNEITTSINVPTTDVSAGGYYAAGSLYRTVTADESGRSTVEYKDLEGHIVLKKVQIASTADPKLLTGWLSTFYVYDDFGMLRFVIPPKATQQLADPNGYNWNLVGANSDYTLINELCFRYEYDARKRLIAKRMPGANWIYMVYDSKDRMAFTQDGNLRGNGGNWMATLYDVLNRPVLSGMLTGSYTHKQLISNMAGLAYGTVTTVDGMSIEASPLPANSTFISLTRTHLDDYAWTTATYSNTYNPTLEGSSTNVYNEKGLTDESKLVTGMVTGTETRVIEDRANLGNGAMLATVTWYDDKGRSLQANSTNYKGGTDVTTTLYHWSGLPISTYTEHTNPDAVAADAKVSTKRIATDFMYDHTGKVTEISKRIFRKNGTVTEQVQLNRIVLNAYDDIGQLLTKNIGQKRNATGVYVFNPVTPLDALNYSYNIRGWLKGINKDKTATSVTSMTNTWFAMELSYDWGFSTNQFNGNIAGVKWRTQGDDKDRAYGYNYDAANRLKKADFNQYGSSWVNAAMDFSVSNLNYDFNGNIKSMNQKGMKLSSIIDMDLLNYTYGINGIEVTNKLTRVMDDANDNSSVLGDFKYDPATTSKTSGTDYAYDDNGNLTKDNNKKITSISYNHLNLPYQINVAGKGTITYIYDASGNKLEKRTSEAASTANSNTAIQTTTTYIGGFVYQKVVKTGGTASTDGPTLQYFAQEEGRAREVTTGTGASAVTIYNFDFFEKDHLGNVRVMLTDEVKKDAYPTLDFEGAANTTAVINQDAAWDNSTGGPVDVIGTRTTRPGAMGTSTTNGTYVKSIIKSSPTAVAIGAAKLLKVMAGDQISTSVDYYYTSGNFANNNADGITTLTTSLLSVLAGSADVSASVKGGAPAITTTLSGDPNVAAAITQPESSGSPTTKPKAYLHILFFDERFVYDNTSSIIVQATTADALATIVKNSIKVKRNGYAYIYGSNESNSFVYFDNFKLTHIHGPLVQEAHYSPWGLKLAAISSDALAIGGAENKRLFNKGSELQNKEFSDGIGLEEYDTHFRQLDPQIGRWNQIDPKIENGQESFSPYISMGDDPIRYNDPNGDIFGLDNLVGAAIGAAIDYGTQVVENYSSGKSLGQSFTHIDGTRIAVSAAVGFVTDGVANVAGKFISGTVTKVVAGSVSKAVEVAAISTEKSVLKVGIDLANDAAKKGGWTSLKGVFDYVGTTTTKASEFFGWGNSTTITKGVGEFSQKNLVANGWTKENLIQLAKAYNDQIIKAQSNGAVNAAAAVRKGQILELIRTYFAK